MSLKDLHQRQALRQRRRQDQRLRSRPALWRRRVRGHPQLRRQGVPPGRAPRPAVGLGQGHLAGNPHDARRRWPRPSTTRWPSTASRTAISAWWSPAAPARWASIPTGAAIPQVIIIADHISLYPDELYEKGLEIVTVSVMRNHPAALSPRIKSLNYLNNILAKIEGIQAGCIEALMLNHKGEVAECTGDNIFLVRHGALLTPPIDAGILEGITRDAVIGLARQSRHRRARNAADQARRVYCRRVFPDRHGGRSGAGGQGRQPHRSATAQPGPITRELMARFHELTRS